MMNKKKQILAIDDEAIYGDILVEILSQDYDIQVASGGENALHLLGEGYHPDLILLDIVMPEMDGFQVCRSIKARETLADIPIIFLTIKSSPESEANGLKLGAVDYISKPISAPIVKARVETHLRLSEYTHSLEKRIRERTQELNHTQDVAIYCMSSLAETRDHETGNHILRTQHYVKALAEYLSKQQKYQDELTDEVIDLIFRSAPLHDIGKVGVPDHILMNPGKLEGEDWKIMQGHVDYGYEAIVRAEEKLGKTTFLHHAKDIVYTHHEKWDGSGYPRGIHGEEIPISGRMMAIADVYDALISERVYKPAFPHEKAVEYITQQRGKHFDPELVDVFIELEQQFRDIARQFTDEHLSVS
jgi:putative two-component system response regulator